MFSSFRDGAKGLLCATLLLCLALAPAQAAFTTLHHFTSNYNSGAYPVGTLAQRGGVFYGVTQYGTNGYGNAFKMTTTGVVTTLTDFVGGASSPYYPNAGLVYDPATDAFYGTSLYGGSSGLGTVFKMTPTGTVTVLHSFTGGASNGQYPYAGLLLASDGNLYGVTYYGGTDNEGIIFKITTGGSFTLLHSFTYDASDPAGYPFLGLTEAPNGKLYGASYYASGYYGGIFKINKDGTGYAFVHGFNSGGSLGRYPYSDLMTASDGNLYGVCNQGGVSNLGTIYKVDPSTDTVTVLHLFDGFTGARPGNSYHTSPQYRLLQGSDGRLYGTTREGGYYGWGTAFRVTLAGVCTVLAHLNYTDARQTANPLTQSGTSFYCTSFYGGLSAVATSTNGYGAGMQITGAGVLKVIHSFYIQDGHTTYGGVIQNGTKYYGVTYIGGAYGYGTIYEVTAGGAHKIIKHLNNYLGEGAYPLGGLVKGPGTDKNMYGTTIGGGRYGAGTIFKVSTSGKFTVLHHFHPGEGYYPLSRLLVGADKNLYGTAYYGGPAGVGAIFCIDRAGKKFKVIHYFSGPDGAYPSCTLAQDPVSKRLYGTAYQGGANSLGTVYSLKPDGSDFMVLYHFYYDGGSGTYPNGYYPHNGPVILSGGFLYGLARYGGTSGNGVLFKTNVSTGATSAFFNFNNGAGQGHDALGGLILEGGFFYGTCQQGGATGYGTIWKINATTAAFTLLKNFAPATDGSRPQAGVILGTDGQLYGTTLYDGADGYGTVFQQTTTP